MNSLVRTFDPSSYVFDGRRFEALKWLAFSSMILDHVSLFFGDHTGPFFYIGRFAFPVFCLTFGAGLALSSDPVFALRRLVLPGLLAEFFWRISGHSVGVNVLLSFCLVGFSCLLFDRSKLFGAVSLLLLLCSHFMEGGFLTPLLVGGSYIATRSRSVSGLALVCAMGGFVIAFAAAWLACAAMLCMRAVPIPRFRWFAWAYAGHVGLFALLTISL